MASRRTLALKTREQRELEHYRDHDARPYVRERCGALLKIAGRDAARRGDAGITEAAGPGHALWMVTGI